MKPEYKYYYKSKTNPAKDGIGWFRRIYKVDSKNNIVAHYSLDKSEGIYYKKWRYTLVYGDVINNCVLLTDKELFLKLL